MRWCKHGGYAARRDGGCLSRRRRRSAINRRTTPKPDRATANRLSVPWPTWATCSVGSGAVDGDQRSVVVLIPASVVILAEMMAVGKVERGSGNRPSQPAAKAARREGSWPAPIPPRFRPTRRTPTTPAAPRPASHRATRRSVTRPPDRHRIGRNRPPTRTAKAPYRPPARPNAPPNCMIMAASWWPCWTCFMMGPWLTASATPRTPSVAGAWPLMACYDGQAPSPGHGCPVRPWPGLGKCQPLRPARSQAPAHRPSAPGRLSTSASPRRGCGSFGWRRRWRCCQ